MYTAKELLSLSKEELTKELESAGKDKFEAETLIRMGQSKTHHKRLLHRKQVARIQTVQRQKTLTSPTNL